MAETKWTADICGKLAKEFGAMVFVNQVNIRGTNGWPDRFISHPLWAGWIEFKGERTPWSNERQRIIFRRIRAAMKNRCVVVREPNRIENESFELITNFDGTAYGLLQALAQLP